MNRNGHSDQQYNEIWDVVVKNALIDHSNTYFGQVPTEEEIKRSHDFSPGFQKRMEELLGEQQNNRQTEVSQTEDDAFLQLDQSFWEEWKRTAGNTTNQETTASSVVESGQESAPACQNNMREDPLGGKADTQRENNVLSGKKEKKKKKWRVRKPVRAAAAVILIVGVVGTSVMRFEPIRATIMQTVVNFEGQGVLVSNMAEDDYHMVFRDPTFIPQGYEIASKFEDENVKWLTFFNGQNTLKIIYSISNEKMEATFDNERHLQNQTPVLIKNRYNALIFSPEDNTDINVISWHNGIVQYDIYGYESQELLIKIAESMMK